MVVMTRNQGDNKGKTSRLRVADYGVVERDVDWTKKIRIGGNLMPMAGTKLCRREVKLISLINYEG
jgi:hypothetical protein